MSINYYNNPSYLSVYLLDIELKFIKEVGVVLVKPSSFDHLCDHPLECIAKTTFMQK